MNMNRYIILSLLSICLTLCYSCKKDTPEPKPEPVKYSFRHDGSADVFGPDNQLKASFRIEIVESEEEVVRGLKYRENLDDDAGMFFIFEYPDLYDFWMQDTYLPLDMLFIASDGTLNEIHENAVPFSEERIHPTKIHQYVLEIKAGLGKKYNLQSGDKVLWKRL